MMRAAPLDLLLAGLLAVPAFLWAILAYNLWAFPRTRLAGAQLAGLFRFLPILSTVIALYCVVNALLRLIGAAPEADFLRPLLLVIGTLAVVALGPLVRHMLFAGGSSLFSDQRPSRAWLVVNYGSGVVVAAVVVPLLLHGPATSPTLVTDTISTLYLLAMWALGDRHAHTRGSPRSGPLRLGTLLGHVHWADEVIFAIIGVLIVGLVIAGLTSDYGPGRSVVIAAIGVLAAVPFALRALAQVLRQALLAGAAITTAGALYFGVHAITASLASPLLRGGLDMAAVLALALLLGPGRSWLQAAIDRVVLLRSRRFDEELQGFLLALSPELGVHECSRRALAEVARVMHLPGAAILLAREGGAVVHGTLALEPVVRVWPTGAAADALPAGAFVAVWLSDAGLREALLEANVVVVVPIRSPRQRWGHLFISTDLLGWARGQEALETLESFAARLALVLDAAELLARAVAVERSLAHAEKLAAIGETAARIAHEIRNPVTAARSLAQLLRREPTSPLNAEHAELILTELERVERQVAALLRFARREELRFEPVDAGELVRTTAESFHPRLEEAGIEVAVAAADGVMVRADREKLRQVLINLIENAMDALTDTGERRLSLAVGGANGTATLRVADSGPGIPADALPRLFEPFFSLKPHGTGLGLAIARRTVEAHGGRIEAASPPEGGMAFRIELPLADPLA